jgi:hypothetical protein
MAIAMALHDLCELGHVPAEIVNCLVQTGAVAAVPADFPGLLGSLDVVEELQRAA